ncbi:serine hydrolase [Planctomycetaceae bacterium SH139]
MQEFSSFVVRRLLCLGVVILAVLPPLLAPSLVVGTDAQVTANAKGEEAGGRFDIVLRRGRVIDGTGAPWYVADVGIRTGRIAAIGDLGDASAEVEIDVRGKVISPGFIDMMGQTATPMLDDPKTAMNLLTQGITTINAGEGESAAPLGPDQGARRGWTTMAEYFATLESQGLPINVVQTIGHTQVRQLVIGDDDRRPFDDELKQMRSLVREAMEAGAIGVSTALIYPPAVYADPREIAALAEVAGSYGGRYFTHMRNEGDRLLEAIDEALEIGQLANCPVHIFHLKAAGEDNWGKMPLAIARIQAARAGGQQVTADIYPYINNGLGIAALIHPRHFAKGRAALLMGLEQPELRAEIREEIESSSGWENWYRHAGRDWDQIIVGKSNATRYAEYDGQSIASIASALGEDPWDTFFALVNSGAFVLPQTMTEANKILAMQQEFISFCTDVGPSGGNRIASHPRASGSFPRLLAKYVRELGVLSWEQAIARASAVAANEVMAYDRGKIAVGLAADVIVFDQKRIAERATFATPQKLSVGVELVIVNGQLVLRDGEYTGLRPGRVLRGPGYRDKDAAHRQAGGPADARFESFDRLFSELIEEHRLPGVSVAVSERGQLVFARGYGFADIGNRQPVNPASLFRIASISKPITAVAILQLVEQGKLRLDECVFDVLDYEQQFQQAGDAIDPRLKSITIEQLLQHRGGWDRDKSFDAMFQTVRFARQLDEQPPGDTDMVIQAMLTQPLDFDPGTEYSYSNFGYCLLGRVIETRTEQPYETYVQQHVLAPLGITQMRIGKTRAIERTANEVRYYHPTIGRSVFSQDLEQAVPSPYGAWYLEAMDAHGGWLASASDLARFAAAFDDPQNCSILTADSIALMYSQPQQVAEKTLLGKPEPYYYSMGWSNRQVGANRVNHWHNGSLPGTTAVMIRRHDGKNLVALLNTRTTPTGVNLGGIVDNLLHRAADQVEHWPAVSSLND